MNFITEDIMLINTDLYENRMFTNIVSKASFGVEREGVQGRNEPLEMVSKPLDSQMII